MNERAKKILNFWFHESTHEQRFGKNTKFDGKIKSFFYKDYIKAANNDYEHWQNDSYECLALIVLLDQFSRNLFRNNSKAFDMDFKSLTIASLAIDKKYHKIIQQDQIIFIFLPFMHSENINDQKYCYKLIKENLNTHPMYNETMKFMKITLEYNK